MQLQGWVGGSDQILKIPDFFFEPFPNYYLFRYELVPHVEHQKDPTYKIIRPKESYFRAEIAEATKDGWEEIVCTQDDKECLNSLCPVGMKWNQDDRICDILQGMSIYHESHE